MTPDVNVPVAASHADHPHHRAALAWVEAAIAAAANGAALTLMPMVVVSFLRLVTSAKVFHRPTPIDNALTFVDALLSGPGEHLVSFDRDLRKLSGRSRFTLLAPAVA